MADNKKLKQNLVKRNVIESLKDLGSDFGSQGSDLLKDTTNDFIKELLGMQKASIKKSGELSPGQSVNMNEAENKKEEENHRLKVQISLERNMASDERALTDRRLQEIRVQLQAITVEISKLAASTGELATQTEIAMIEVPNDPGIYHIVFFEKVLEFLQSFRQKIDIASTWLASSNKRAEKKNYWSMYKKKGSSFLLSPDHYLQRSAG
jgi:hypothetical protein